MVKRYEIQYSEWYEDKPFRYRYVQLVDTHDKDRVLKQHATNCSYLAPVPFADEAKRLNEEFTAYYCDINQYVVC